MRSVSVSDIEWRSLVGSRMRHVWDSERGCGLCGTGFRRGTNRYRNAAWGPPGEGAECKGCLRVLRMRRGEKVRRRSRAYAKERDRVLFLRMSRQEISLLNTVAKRMSARRTDLARAAIDEFCKKALS